MQSIVIDLYSLAIIRIETPNEYRPVLLAFSKITRNSFTRSILRLVRGFTCFFQSHFYTSRVHRFVFVVYLNLAFVRSSDSFGSRLTVFVIWHVLNQIRLAIVSEWIIACTSR